MDNTAYFLRLNTLFYYKPVLAFELFTQYPTESDFLEAFPTLLPRLAATPKGQSTLSHLNTTFDAASILARCASEGIGLLTLEDDAYPAPFLELSDPPLLLFYRGQLSLLDTPLFAIVGPRDMTSYGQSVTEYFSHQLLMYFTLVSGLAKGVDAIAHRIALDAGYGTIAVIGTGIDQVYPAENKALSARIAEQGLLLSEYPLGTGPKPLHFPQRNRLVSGLSLGVLVTEGGLKSGALITAQLALDQNKEVFAVPGSIFDAASQGVHALIQDGATCATHLSDILAQLPTSPLVLPTHAPAPLPVASIQDEGPSIEPSLSGPEFQLLSCMGNHPLGIDDLVLQTGLSLQEVLQYLTFMELKGLVVRQSGQHYQKKEAACAY